MPGDFISDQEMAVLEKHGIAKIEPPKQSLTPSEQARLRGLEEGASLGLSRGGRTFAGGLYEAINPEREQAKLPFFERLGRGMLQEAGREEQITERTKAEHPIAYGVSKGIATMVPVAPTLVTGAALPVIATGGLAGLIETAGEGKVSPSELVAGAAKGAAGGALGVVAAKGLQKLGSTLLESANETVLKTFKLAPTTMRRMKSRGNVLGEAKDLADKLVNADVGSSPQTLRGLYDKSAKVLKRTGEKLGSLYDEAEKATSNSKFSISELKDTIAGAIERGRQFGTKEELGSIVEESTKGLLEKYGARSLDPLGGTAAQELAKKKIGIKDAWEYVRYLDDLSRQWERASDPAFASKADNLIEAAGAVRKAIVSKIEAASPELAKEISVTSDLYRKLAVVEGSLGDQVIRVFSQNRSIPRMTATEAITSLLPGTPARLGAAAVGRGIGKGAQALVPAARAGGIAGTLESTRQRFQ